MKAKVLFLSLLLTGCSYLPPTPAVAVLPEPTELMTSNVRQAVCGGMELEQISYKVGTQGIGLVSAGDQCYGFLIEEGMGLVLSTQFTSETAMHFSLNGNPVELEKFDYGFQGKRINTTGNYILYVDVADNQSSTVLNIVINYINP